MAYGKVQQAIIASLSGGRVKPAREIASDCGHLDTKWRISSSFTTSLRKLMADGVVVRGQNKLQGQVYKLVAAGGEPCR